jgi:hypothetical protein
LSGKTGQHQDLVLCREERTAADGDELHPPWRAAEEKWRGRTSSNTSRRRRPTGTCPSPGRFVDAASSTKPGTERRRSTWRSAAGIGADEAGERRRLSNPNPSQPWIGDGEEANPARAGWSVGRGWRGENEWAVRFIREWYKVCKYVEVFRLVLSMATREAANRSGSRSEAASALTVVRSTFSSSASQQRFSIS